MRRIEERREKRSLLETLPEVKPDADLQLDAGMSFTRPSSPDLAPDNKSPWRPLTNRDYASEFKTRCAVLAKMRAAVRNRAIPPSSSRPSSPRLQALTPKSSRTRLPEPDELTQNLWTCYLMLLENGASRSLSPSRSLTARAETDSLCPTCRRQEPPAPPRVRRPAPVHAPLLRPLAPQRGAQARLAEADGRPGSRSLDRLACRRYVLSFSLSLSVPCTRRHKA